MANKTWKLTVNEDELKAIINHNNALLFHNPRPEISLRIHDLVKRLNKDTPEIEQQETTSNYTPQAPEAPAGWGKY